MAFLLDEGTHGDSSLLSPAMKAWQGPALYSYNDAQFSPPAFRRTAFGKILNERNDERFSRKERIAVVDCKRVGSDEKLFLHP